MNHNTKHIYWWSLYTKSSLTRFLLKSSSFTGSNYYIISIFFDMFKFFISSFCCSTVNYWTSSLAEQSQTIVIYQVQPFWKLFSIAVMSSSIPVLSLFFIMAIFSAICLYSSDTIILSPSSAQSSTMEILLLNLVFYSKVPLFWSPLVFHY